MEQYFYLQYVSRSRVGWTSCCGTTPSWKRGKARLPNRQILCKFSSFLAKFLTSFWIILLFSEVPMLGPLSAFYLCAFYFLSYLHVSFQSFLFMGLLLCFSDFSLISSVWFVMYISTFFLILTSWHILWCFFFLFRLFIESILPCGLNIDTCLVRWFYCIFRYFIFLPYFVLTIFPSFITSSNFFHF